MILVLCTLVPVLGFSAFVVMRLADHERAAVERGLRDTVRALASAADRDVRGVMDTLGALAQSTHLRDVDLTAFHAELVRVVSTQAGWRHAFLVGRDGRSLVSSAVPYGAPLPPVADRDYWRQVMATGKPAVSDLIVSRLTGHQQLTVAAPVVLRGEVVYVLCAALGTDVLTRALTEQHFPATWIAAVLDRNHILIGRSRTPETFVGKPATADLSAAIRASREGAGVVWAVTKDGIPTYAAFSRVPSIGWTVVLGLPAEDVTASRQSTLFFIGGFGILLVAMSLALALVVGRRIADSIRSLARLAEDLESGPVAAPRSSAVREVNDVDQALISAMGRRRQAEEQATALAATSRALAQSLDPQVVAEHIAASTRLLLNTQNAVVYRLDPAAQSLTLLAGEGPRVDWSQFLPRGTGAAGLAVAERRPIATSDLFHDPRIDLPEDVRAVISVSPSRAVLAVPLVVGDLAIGALVATTAPGHVFSDDEIALAQALADQAALALHNADVVRQAQTRQVDLESLLDASRQLVAMQPLESLLERIAESCAQLLRADSVGVRLVDGEDLYTAASWGDVPPGMPTARVKIGESLAGRVAASGEPMTVDDLTADTHSIPSYHEGLVRFGYRSWLGVPVKMGDRVIGVLTIRFKRTRRLSPREIFIGTAFASHAAAAIETARLYEEADRRRHEAEMLTHAARMLTETLDASAVAERTAEIVHELLATKTSALRLLEPDGALRALAFGGRGRSLLKPGHVTLPGIGVGALVLAANAPVWSRDVLTDPRLRLTEDLREGYRRSGVSSVLGVPLRAKGETIGTFSVGDVAGRTFSEREIALLQAFADHAAVAIEKTRLYESAERRRREAEALAHAARDLTASLDASAVAERTVAHVLPLVNAPYAQLRVLCPDGSLEVVAVTGDHAEIAPVGHVIPPGAGVSGICVRERRPVAVSNIHEDAAVELRADLRAAMAEVSLSAVLAVPLSADDEILGVLAVLDGPGRVYSDRETQLVQTFADQAAIAFKNARTLDDLTLHQGRLEALLASSRRLGHIQPVESLLSNIAEACGRLLDSPSVGFRLVDADELVVAGAWGDAKEMMPTPRLKVGQSLSGIVARTGEVLIAPDLANDARLIPSHRDVVLRAGYRAFLGVPVKLGERVLGVLNIRSRRAYGFTKADIALATALAGHAAIALENARLFRDVQRAYDELSQTQEQLVQAQKMEAVGRLAGGIAHDFNNLLTVVIGRTDFCLEKLAPDSGLTRDLALVRKTATRAAGLTKQLLAFSRKQILEPKVLDLNALVANLMTMLQRLIGEDIELLHLPRADLGRVKADPGQIEQIVINLAVNARDAMPRGGQLVLEAANVEVDDRLATSVQVEPGSYVMLAISDTGVGMDAATAVRIFEPFFTTKAPGQGTGLGLATVYGIVKQSEGSIRVDSEPGRGTTFKIYLPRASDDNDSASRTDEAVLDGSRGTETILLVEDEIELRELGQEILENQGYTVLAASRPDEAFQASRTHAGRIDLLLTDVVMPGMNGRDLAELLLRARPEIRVLFMSGYTDDAIARHGVLEPGVALLSKPFSARDLVEKVREALAAPCSS